MDENKVVENVESNSNGKAGVTATIIKCIAVLLSVAMILVTLSHCVTKYTESSVKAAEMYASANAGAVSGNASSSDVDSVDDTVVDDSTVADDTVVDDSTSTDTDASVDTSTDTSTDSADTNTTTPNKDNGSSSANTASKKPSTKAEIVKYFNTASNKVKTSAKSVTKDREENYQAAPINLGALGLFEGVVNKLIDDNMGVNEEQSGRTGTSAADKNAIYPVENESWSSKLTEADVKTATCTEKDGVYTITLTLVNDPLATSYSHGSGHHGKAFSIVMPQTIKDNAGGAASLLGSLKVGYENGKIIVNVDAATGNITSAKYDFVWLLNIDMFGGITAHFGIKTDYTVKW